MSTSRIGNTKSPSTGHTNLAQVATEGAKGTDDPGAVQKARAKGVMESPPPAGAPLPKGNYDVNISNDAKTRAQAFQKAFDIAKSTPDIREDRVKDLKERIQNGTYQIDAGQIADAMLREAAKEHLALNEDR